MNQEQKILPFLRNGVAQIAFVVEDLDKTVEAYWKYCGIGPWHFYTYGSPLVKKMTRHGDPTDYKMRVALSYFGPMRIELIQQISGDTVYSDFIKEHGYGIQHLGVLVDDMDAAIVETKAAGFEVTMDGSGFGLDGDGHYAYLNTEKVLGTTIELIARPKNRLIPEKIFPLVEEKP